MFFGLQVIFIPDASSKRSNADRTIHGFFKLEKDTVDVLFLGASHVELGISPMKLYEDLNICSYSLATDGQPIDASYYLLKDAFTRQSPTVVVFDVSGLFAKDDSEKNIRWRHVLENYPLNSTKIEMAKAYGKIEAGDGMLSAIFPFFEYHNRWNSLDQTDFHYTQYGENCTLGQYLLTNKNGVHILANLESINDIAQIQQEDSRIEYVKDGQYYEQALYDKLYVPEIPRQNLDYLKKMKDLCEKHGAHFLLIKVPVMNFTQYYTPAWTLQKSAMIKELSTEYGIDYFDILYDTDAGIDWTTDTCDAGAHLNVKGAEKVTDTLENYLLTNYEIRGQNNPQYDKYCHYYKKLYAVATLQSEWNFYSYLELLNENKEHWTILVTAAEDFVLGMDNRGHDLLSDLGLTLNREAAFRDSYLAVIDQGYLKYEALSGRKTEYRTDINGFSFYLNSVGWNVGNRPYCSIQVNGYDYAHYASGGRGLNFVIFDNESGLVIDSVSFDTSLESKISTRNQSLVTSLLRNYESQVCFEETIE